MKSNVYTNTTKKKSPPSEFRIILISVIIKKCPEKYMTTIKYRITKFCQCGPLNVIYHLYTEYGTITYSNLTANFDCMNARWNPPTPIADLFQQLNDGKYSA